MNHEATRGVVVLAAALAFLLVPTAARAQACCSATSAGEDGVVGRCHHAMVSAGAGLVQGLGAVDSDGRFRSYRSTESTDGVLSLAGGIRPFDRRLRVGAVLPARLQHRAAGELSSTALRPGDLAWSSGFLVTEDPMTGITDSLIPFLEPMLRGTLPTGVSADDSTAPLLSDATGNGSSALGGGLKIVKFLSPTHAVSLSAEYLYTFAHEVSGPQGPLDVRRGPAWDLGVGWTYEGSIFWSVGMGANLTLQRDLFEDGERVTQSSSRRVSTALTFRRSLSFPWWDLRATLAEDLLLGRNLPRAGATLMLGVQRNFL